MCSRDKYATFIFIDCLILAHSIRWDKRFINDIDKIYNNEKRKCFRNCIDVIFPQKSQKSLLQIYTHLLIIK